MNQSQSGGPFGDKRTALAFFLSFIVIISYTELYLKPNFPTPPASSSSTADEASSQGKSPTTTARHAGPVLASQDSASPIAMDSSGEASPSEPSAIEPTSSNPNELALTSEVPSAEQIKDSPTLVISSSTYRAKVLRLGGQLESFGLKNYTKELEGEALYNLVSRTDDTPLPFMVEILGGSDANLMFPAPSISTDGVREADQIELKDGQTATVTFEASLQSGGKYTKTYRFVGGTYFVDVSAELSSPPAAAAPLTITWSSSIPDEIAKSSYDPVNFSFLFPNDKVEHKKVIDIDAGTTQEHLARWGSLGDKYFMASLISLGESQQMAVSRSGSNYMLAAVGSKQDVKVKAYLGPKNYSELKALNFVELHRNVNLGIFSFLAIPLLTVINFCYGLLGNYGLAIILMTLLIKFAFLPLTQVSLKSMKAMQDLQPEIKALRERIKDPTQLNQEMFALYKRRGVNPMGGCLPMLIQIPVFLGLYNALLNATEMRHAPFALWIKDLSAPEALYLFGIPVPVMIILMGCSMFLQQYLMPSNMDPQQRKIMLMMPVVFTVMFIVFPFPSGLVLYWLVNNLISIVQQVYLRTERSVGPFKATAIASVSIFLVGFILTKV